MTATGGAPAAASSDIREGSAKIFSVSAASASSKRDDASKQNVFYNPAQVYNRDLSIVILTVYSVMKRLEEKEKERKRILDGKQIYEAYEGVSVLEALAASGLRSVRYWKEVPFVKNITVNDFDETAVKHMKENLKANDVPSDKVRPNHGDAIMHCYTEGFKAYDVIDLDPYGTASPFLDAAIRGIKNGGLLCVTSTDMPILGGNHPEACFYRYGGTPLKAKYVHEMSLRLLLNAIQSTAARHQRVVEPLVCASMDFYIRVFVRVRDSPLQAKDLAKNTGIVFQCVQCESFDIQPLGSQEFPEPKKPRYGGENKPGKQEQQGNRTEGADGGTKADKEEHDAESQPVAEPNSSSTTAHDDEDMDVVDPESLLDNRILTAVSEARAPKKPAQPKKGLKYRPAKVQNGVGGECRQCGGRMSLGGPCYLGPLYDPTFLHACLAVCELNLFTAVAEDPEEKKEDETSDAKRRKVDDVSSKNEGEKIKVSEAGTNSPETKKNPVPEITKCTDKDFLLPHITQWRKIQGMLTAMSEELLDVPLHYNLPALCSSVRADCVPMRRFRAAIKKLGYRISHFHRDANAVKTDADNQVVYDVIRKWAKHSAALKVKEGEGKEQTVSKKKAKREAQVATALENKLLDRAILTDGVDGLDWDTLFDEEPSPVITPTTTVKKVARFLPNPEKNWGPKPRAKPTATA
ncbi:unnamed protein product [Amoebophrya sp. A120]|nr:unnamed protein product [Amoebophrya sp. A120]|eukprot:GSA120T00004962001.1